MMFVEVYIQYSHLQQNIIQEILWFLNISGKYLE